MLEISDIHASYGRVKTLSGVSLSAKAGEITCLLGRNGAGKTTVMRTITGLLAISAGSITLEGQPLHTLPPEQIARQRVGYIPQGRRLFAELSVSENIEIGLLACGEGRETRDWVLDIFPRLRERLTQRAETLSGGEQQMLATARALCLRPKLLLLDEPTEGLQPSMIAQIRDVVLRMKAEGLAVLLVEQRMEAILTMADHAVFIENGASIETLRGDALRAAPETLTRHLGV
ncbi:ABC transporter ATP-binding protein [Oceaniglobus ichthyenteri]|uniref:ABC transporter ATP-binding protein n=1 Tax=Oceaniglobus ichthyenteri TaxID=2136177 RepID=UPI000D3776A6|nr:ABC transporter ATP-binding protein [Oceaniglobus ichthyenteri]